LNYFRGLLDTSQPEIGPTSPTQGRRRLWIDAGRILLLAGAYFLTARVSMQFSGMPAHISFVWLPAGLSLAALLIGGLRLAPGIVLGSFAAQYSVGGGAWICAAFALGSTLSAMAGSWVLQRKFSFSRALDHPRDVLSLVAVGAFLSPVIAATVGASSAYSGHLEPSHEWGTLWAVWWAGDALGVLLLAPVLLSWIGTRKTAPARRNLSLALVALQLFLGAYVFAVHSGAGAGAYVYLSVALLTAMHLPPTWVTVVSLLTFCAAAVGTLLGGGPFAAATLWDSLVSLQTYGIVSSLATLLVSSLAQQRERVAAKLSESLERFQQLTTLSSDWYWEQDEELRFTHIAGRAVDEHRVRADKMIGHTRWEVEANHSDEGARKAHDEAVSARGPFRDLVLGSHTMDAGSVVAVSGAPWFDRAGQFRGYRGIARDITLQQRAEREISETKRFLDALIAAIPTPVLVKDEQHRYIGVNASFCEFFRKSSEQILGKTDFDFFAHEDAAFYQQTDDEALNGHAPVAYERPYTIGDDVRWMLVRKSALTRPDGSRVVVLVLIDVTERRAAEAALRESETRFRDFSAAAGEYVWEADLEGHFTYVSSRVQSVWGYSDHELTGRTPAELMPPGEAERVREWLRHNMRPDGSFNDLEHTIVDRHGETRWVLINAVGMVDATGKRIGQRGTGRDITDRKSAEARISYLATRDPLTELPNRVLFNDRLEQGIVAARRTGQSLALLFIDLDRFKNINDSLGHQVGDLLLREVADRMQGCIRKGDTLSRLGGDEFVVTLEGLQQAEDAAQVAAKIIKTLSRPCEIAGHTLNTSCSIGISIYPLDADDDRALMKNADTAMYHAKERGRNNYQFFSPEMNVRAVERHTLETALRAALDRQEFALYYQPLVDMRSGKIVGVEALLRWQHPQRGVLSPATFMAVAEESGLIEPIGQWVLRTACQRAKAWLDSGYPALKVAVNISARELIRPREFARGISRILSSTGLDPGCLELEMTESLLIQNAEENIAVLRKLGDEGVRIAVDDFGKGYSSLSYLRQLPIDALKIDRSFVRDIERDSEDVAIIRAIVAMAHSLGLQVTAEGVETRGQLDALARLGCDEYQGYLFSRPLPAVEIAARFLAPGELNFEASAAG
jgi:diguanylate cyclase (GGDEF)-like protein/PAS domain S-box-containing protein